MILKDFPREFVHPLDKNPVGLLVGGLLSNKLIWPETANAKLNLVPFGKV